MDSWTLQGDSYSFLRTAPRTFSLCRRDGTPNHVEIFDIINVPSQRSAISETTCLCDIFGDDCESPSLSSSPSAGTIIPTQTAEDGAVAATSPVDDSNDSSGSYHTAPGSSEGEDGFDDSGERFLSPHLLKQSAERCQLQAENLNFEHPESCPNIEEKGKSSVLQSGTSSPPSEFTNTGERTSSPGQNTFYTTSPRKRESPLSSSSSVKERNTPFSTDSAQTFSNSFTPSPVSEPKGSVGSRSTESVNGQSSPDSTLAQNSPEVKSSQFKQHSNPSPELTSKDLSQDFAESSFKSRTVISSTSSEHTPTGSSLDLTESSFQSRAISSSPLYSQSGIKLSSHSRETLVSPELKNTPYAPDTQASSPFSELSGRVSLPDLFSRGSTPEIEESNSSPFVISTPSPGGVDTTSTSENRNTSLSVEAGSTLSSPVPRYTPPSPLISTSSGLEFSVSPELRHTNSSAGLLTASPVSTRSSTIAASPGLVKINVSPELGHRDTSPTLLSACSTANSRSPSIAVSPGLVEISVSPELGHRDSSPGFPKAASPTNTTGPSVVASTGLVEVSVYPELKYRDHSRGLSSAASPANTVSPSFAVSPGLGRISVSPDITYVDHSPGLSSAASLANTGSNSIAPSPVLGRISVSPDFSFTDSSPVLSSATYPTNTRRSSLTVSPELVKISVSPEFGHRDTSPGLLSAAYPAITKSASITASPGLVEIGFSTELGRRDSSPGLRSAASPNNTRSPSIAASPGLVEISVSTESGHRDSSPGLFTACPAKTINSSITQSPGLEEISVSPELRHRDSSPSFLSAAFCASPANSRSPSPRHISTPSESRDKVHSPVLSYTSSPSPAFTRKCYPFEHICAAPSPEIRITTSSPEPHTDSVSSRAFNSSPHITGISYTVVQPEERHSPPFLELSNFSSPDPNRAFVVPEARSPTQVGISEQRSIPESTGTPQDSPHISDFTGCDLLPEITLSNTPSGQTPSPDLKHQTPSSEPSYKTLSPLHHQSPTPQHAASQVLSPVFPAHLKNSPVTLSAEYCAGHTQPTHFSVTPEVEKFSSSAEIVTPSFEVDSEDQSDLADIKSNLQLVSVCSPIITSPFIAEENIESLPQQENTERNDSPERKEVNIESFGHTLFQTGDSYNNARKSLSPSSVIPTNKSPIIEPVPKGTPDSQRIEKPQPHIITYSPSSEISGSFRSGCTPEHSRGLLPNKVCRESRVRFIENMAHHASRRRTPSPPLTRFTPVHIVAPEKPYRQWQNRKHSPSQLLASLPIGNLNTPAADRENPNVALVDNNNQAHCFRLGEQLEMDREIQLEEREIAKEEQKERDRKKEEQVPKKGEGWQGDSSYRGEQVELSFNSRNRKGPVSHSAAPTSKETHQGLPTVHSYSESLLATRQLPQQPGLLRLAPQQDNRGGVPSRHLKPPAHHNKKSAVGRTAVSRPGRSSSSSMGSELDEADNEVKWFSDVAFRRLSSPEIDYLDMYNSSRHSSANISRPSTQESPAGGNPAWQAYADFRGSASKLDNDDVPFRQSSVYYSDGLDPSRRYEMGSFECVDVALEREDSRKKRRGVPKREIQLKRRTVAEGKQDESSENSSPAVMLDSPCLDTHHRETFMRQNSTPASTQESYPSECSLEPKEENETNLKMQKSASMDEICPKAKMASCLIKNVLSKKMQSVDKESWEEAEEDSSAFEENNSLSESAVLQMKRSPEPDPHNRISTPQSDYGLTSEAENKSVKETIRKDGAKSPKAFEVTTHNRPSSSTSSKSVNFSQSDSEEADYQSRNATSLRSEIRSELKVPFDSKQSDYGLASEAVNKSGKAETIRKDGAKSPKACGVITLNRPSSSTSSKSVNFSQSDSEEADYQSRNATSLRSEIRSGLKVPFDSKQSRCGVQRGDDIKFCNEMEDGDPANASSRNTGAPPDTGTSISSAGMTNTDEECENTEDHKQLHQGAIGAYSPKPQEISVKSVEKKKASLNVCLTPEAENKPEISPLYTASSGEEEERLETSVNEKIEINEGNGNNKVKTPLHKVRDVRQLVKNTYNLSFKSTRAVMPSQANDLMMQNLNEEGRNIKEEKEKDVMAWKEQEEIQKMRTQPGREDESKLKMGEEQKVINDSKLPATPSESKGKPLPQPQPMQIECKAVCWKEEKSKILGSKKEDTSNKLHDSPVCVTEEIRESHKSLETNYTGDLTQDEPCQHDPKKAEETKEEISKMSDKVGKPVAVTIDRKPPMLGSLPKLPSKDREVSTAVVMIRDGSSKNKLSPSPAQEEYVFPIPCDSLSPRSMSDGNAEGNSGHSVSMLLKEKGYQADIGAVVATGQNSAGVKGLPRKHVNYLEIPLQTTIHPDSRQNERHRDRTLSSSSIMSGPSSVSENANMLTTTTPTESQDVKDDKPAVTDTSNQKTLPSSHNPQEQTAPTKQKEIGDFEAVKRLDPTFPPRSPAIRRIRPPQVDVKRGTQKEETPAIAQGNNRAQTIEVKSVAKNSQKPIVPPKPCCKFKPTDAGAMLNEAQRLSATLSSVKTQGDERSQTIVVSSPTIYRKISNESSSASNYTRKLAVSAMSSLKPPPSKTTATAISNLSNPPTAPSEGDTYNDRGQQLQQPFSSLQSARHTHRPTTLVPESAPFDNLTSASGSLSDPVANQITEPTTGTGVNRPNQPAITDPTREQPVPARMADPREQTNLVTSSSANQPVAAPTTQAPSYTHQSYHRSLSSEHPYRTDDMRFYASDDPPSYDERESFSPLMLPDLTPRRSNRYQPSSRPPPCSCSHPGLTPSHHHRSPHNLTPPAPPHSPSQPLPYPVAQPPLRPHQFRPDPQPMTYQRNSPKSSPLGPSQSTAMYHHPPCPPHHSLIQTCSAERPLQPPQHIDSRRAPVHRSPHQQPPSLTGAPFSDPGRSHSPGLPLDPQFLCGPQSLGPSYGSEYGADTSSLYSESNYGQTPRRVLLDPETGKYFYIEVPVQPLRKMLFDPETGQYVEVLIPQQAMSHSGLYPPSAAPYPPLPNPNMYAPGPQYMPYAAPPPPPPLAAHNPTQPQPPRYPEASGETPLHPSGPGVSYRNQGSKPEPQNHPPLDQNYMESMYYVPTGMNASPNPTPPQYYHKHPPNLPPTGGKRS